MSRWEKKKLGEHSVVVRGSSPRPKGDPRYYGGKIPRLMVSDVSRDGMYVTPKIDSLTEEGAKKSRPMKAGAVVIAVSGDPGQPAILNVDACIHDGFVGLRELDEESIYKPYLFHFLKYFKENLKSGAVGAIYKNLTTHQIRDIQIPLPPLPLQKQIADLLDTADALRRHTAEQLVALDELAQGVFLEMFGDPQLNNKKWGVNPLGILVNNEDSKRIPVKSEDRKKIKGKYDYYGATGVIDKVNDFLFEGEHLLIAEDGKALVNRNKPIAFKAKGKFWVNNHAHVVSANGKAVLTFLEYYFAFKNIRKFITGIDQFKLNRSSLDRIPIFCPPLPLQTHFASIIENIEAQKEALRSSQRESEALFAGLLQEVFSN